MSNTADVPPEGITHDLTMALWRNQSALKTLARRKAWEPSIDDCRRIAEQQIEHLKRAGVERITRRVAVAHSMRPGPVAPSGRLRP